MKHHQRPFCSNYLQNCGIQGLTCEEINSWIDEGGKNGFFGPCEESQVVTKRNIPL